MSEREELITVILARAAGKRIFGYSSDKAGCAEASKGKIPDAWSRICVEGDTHWSAVPVVEPSETEGVP